MRPLAATATCLALATSLAACDDGSQKKQDGEPHYVLGADDQYVAIGDSYTAAPGTGAVTEQNGCAQTEVDYPHRIAEATGMELLDHSCNGANTSNVVSPQQTPKGLLIQDPQIDGIDDDTDLVTFRLGANDYGLINRTFQCSIAFQRGILGSTPQPCTALDKTSSQGSSDDALDEVATNVETALQAIQEKAPDARIMVIGYPQILPPEGSCDLFPLPPGDDDWARGVFAGLNEALESGADAVGATYIDMTGPSEGHDTCSDDPWMAGLESVPGAAVAFHPFTAEGQAVAQLVLAELRS
jgi:lysophospholipase L1-like esterase